MASAEDEDGEDFSDEEIAELKDLMEHGLFVDVEFAPNGGLLTIGGRRVE